MLQFTLLPLCWHNRWRLIFNLDHFNMAPINSSYGNDWGTEELDGGFPACFAAIASHVTIPSKLTDQSWHKQCQICEKLFPHRNSDSASCEMLKEISSHNYAMHPLYCACNHTCQHYHFIPASFRCGSYGTVQRKFTANQITQLCFPSSMQHSMEATVFLVIIYYYYFWSCYNHKHLFLE